MSTVKSDSEMDEAELTAWRELEEALETLGIDILESARQFLGL
jgi:hypothetical protein